MSRKMLIDATHNEETRVAIVEGNKLVEYDYESSSRKPIKGNIYLAKVTRVEPSLQAAFVNFGGNRHGFLPFSEIHPDYFRIPVADREALLAEQEALLAEQEAELEAEARAEAEAAAAKMGGADGEENTSDEAYGSEEQYIEEIGGAVPSLDDSGLEDDAEVLSDDVLAPVTAKPLIVNELSIEGPRDEVWVDDEGDVTDEARYQSGDGEYAQDDEENGFSDSDEINAGQQVGEDGEVILDGQAEGEGEGDRENRGRGDRGRRGRGRGRRPGFRGRRGDASGEERMSGEERFRMNLRRKYKIQEVIKRGQIMLVQANKEERGNKGAAVGTYLSLPGRYCVLMPNSPRAGGVSRKIANYKDRARMREIMKELEVPKGMSVIVRTAGVARTKVEIKRDLDYLMRLWDSIRELTLQSTAPSLVYEEADLIKRAIRDLYTRDVEDIIVAGDSGFKTARNFMKMMVPSHIKKVNFYEDNQIPLFTRYQIESQIQEIGMPTVRLKSGGYLVINQTEALVSIDVNSGKATKERHIEETALKTNLEAADEVARQLRLRDLGGLVVVDFIDMEDRRNNARVERRLKEALSLDRARVQVGRISSFGLLELSRQRLSPSLTEAQYEVCSHCRGTGVIRTPEAMSMVVLRAIEEEGMRGRASQVTVYVSNPVALYILNNKRKSVVELESRYGFEVVLLVDDTIPGSEYRLDISKTVQDAEGEVVAQDAEEVQELQPQGEEREQQPRRDNNREGRGRDRGRRGGRNRGGRDRDNREGREDQKTQRPSNDTDAFDPVDDNYIADDENDSIGNTEEAAQQSAFRIGEEGQSQDRNRRNRNRRRGGRGRNRGGRSDGTGQSENAQDEVNGNHAEDAAPQKQNKQAREFSGNKADDVVPVRSQPVVVPQPVSSVEVTGPRPAAAKKEPQSSASYEVVSEPVKDKKRGWWNRLVE